MSVDIPYTKLHSFHLTDTHSIDSKQVFTFGMNPASITQKNGL